VLDVPRTSQPPRTDSATPSLARALIPAPSQGIYTAWRESNKLLAYFTSGWLWVGISSTALMVTCISIWWIFVLRYARQFSIDIRYDVYHDLSARARILRVDGDGENLTMTMKDFQALGFLVQTLSWYYALNGARRSGAAAPAAASRPALARHGRRRALRGGGRRLGSTSDEGRGSRGWEQGGCRPLTGRRPQA